MHDIVRTLVLAKLINISM